MNSLAGGKTCSLATHAMETSKQLASDGQKVISMDETHSTIKGKVAKLGINRARANTQWLQHDLWDTDTMTPSVYDLCGTDCI